jgi:hypothetical protein
MIWQRWLRAKRVHAAESRIQREVTWRCAAADASRLLSSDFLKKIKKIRRKRGRHAVAAASRLLSSDFLKKT